VIEAIREKLGAGERLSFDDGVALFRHADVVAVGQLANDVRERLHGDRTYFNRNMRLEVTNVCVASCLFCSFAKLEEGAPGAHTMRVEEAWAELESRMDDPPSEIHIVNGLHPGLPFSYYEELLAGFKRLAPDVHLKCFTAVEIHFFARHYGMSYGDVLDRLRRAGLGSLPGGGAEIFHPEVRTRIAHDKATAEEYLEVHRTAHRMDMRTNATML
jgi:aminodeoxyfutalosine synthase